MTRHRADFDVERAVVALPKDERERVRSMLRMYRFGADGTIPLGLAVGDSDRLRRVDVDVPGGKELSIEFFDYRLRSLPSHHRRAKSSPGRNGAG